MVRISTGSIEEKDDASAPDCISVQCLPSAASSIELSEHLVVPCNFLQEGRRRLQLTLVKRFEPTEQRKHTYQKAKKAKHNEFLIREQSAWYNSALNAVVIGRDTAPSAPRAETVAKLNKLG